MKKTYLLFFLFPLLLVACATGKPMVWMEEDVFLTDYTSFEVMQVSNETGKDFDFSITDIITENLKSSLESKGYNVTEKNPSAEHCLVIKSSLTEYEAGSAFKRWLSSGAGATVCTLKTSLIDKRTGEVVGEIITDKSVSAGGLYSIGADKRILRTVATDTVNEIDKRAQEK